MSGDLGDALAEVAARPDGPRPASPVLRMVAYLLDQILLGIAFVILADVLGATSPGTRTIDGKATEVRLVASWFSWSAFGAIQLYQVVGIAVFGTTVGRWICGLRVRATNDERVGWGRAVLRHLTLSVPLVFDLFLPAEVASALAMVAMVALLAPAFADPARRGLHDRLVGTKVEFASPIDQLRARFPFLDALFRPGALRANKMVGRDTDPDRRSKED